VSKLKPDVVMLDVSLSKGMNGLELLKHLRARDETLRVLVFSMYDESIYGERALLAGAHGYVMKSDPVEHIHQAIERVASGRVWASEALMERVLGREGRERDPARDHTRDADGGATHTLSDRELEVLELIGRGLGTRQIAERLHLSIKTIETHRANLKAKLAIESAPQLVRYAVEWLVQRG
jgi:DNA-binding NarL/FixJ family response regulator